MNCYDHPDQMAVAKCTDCGKGLCRDCASLYTIPICTPCNKKRISREKASIKKELLFIVVGGGILTYLATLVLTPSSFIYNIYKGDQPEIDYLILFYVCSGVIAGWRTVGKTPLAIFLVPAPFWWLIYLLVKLVFSVFLGLIMLPIKLIKDIYRLYKLGNINLYD